MKLPSHIKQLLDDISKKEPVASSNAELSHDEQNLVDEIDGELMKLGSLSPSQVNWENAYESSKTLLETRKNIQALYIVWRYSLQQASLAQLQFVIMSLGAVIKLHWEDLHPYGKFSTKLKIARVNETLKILCEKIPSIPIDETTKKQLSNEVASWNKLADIFNLDVVKINDLQAKLKNDLPNEVHSAPVKKINVSQPSSDVVIVEPLDAMGRGSLRRDMFSLAHRVNSHDPDSGIGYLMRGYAAWLELTTLPNANSKGVSDMQPMPPNIVDSFRSVLSNPKLIDLRRIEERLYNNPDWFEGHKFASDIATSLEYHNAAEAIRYRVNIRLKKMPELLSLRHANKTPIVPNNVKLWIEEVPINAVNSVQDTSHDEIDHAEELKFEVKSSQLIDMTMPIDDIIRFWEREIKATHSLRNKARLQLELGKFLVGKKYTNLARAVMIELSKVFEDEFLQKWEPQMFQELQVVQKRLSGKIFP